MTCEHLAQAAGIAAMAVLFCFGMLAFIEAGRQLRIHNFHAERMRAARDASDEAFPRSLRASPQDHSDAESIE